jgi:hypothetical protein
LHAASFGNPSPRRRTTAGLRIDEEDWPARGIGGLPA